jgi:membrane associated rhomboid family serine protease
MAAQTLKLKLVYKPFILIAIILTAGYTFLNWLLFIKFHAFSVDEDIVNFWIPFALPWIPILIWLRPRIKLLNLKRKKGDLPGLYIFIAGFAMCAPIIVAQSYLETASGKLTRLEKISELQNHEPTKYYSLKNFYIDKANIGGQPVFDVSGKNNSEFNMNLYVVLPILNAAADTSSSNCVAWYGIKYHEQISNRLNQQEKQERFQSFANESQADFNQKNVNEFVYFDRIGNTNDHKGYNAAIKNDKKYSGSAATVLIPVNEPFEARNGNKLPWIFGAFAIGALAWLIMVLIPKLDEEALKNFESGTGKKETDVKGALSFFLPKEGFYYTPIIIDLNILIFIIMVFSGLGLMSFNANDLLAWGANFKPVTTDGQWWRLFTSIFLHGGLMHLLANMYALLFIGIFLEPQLGKTKYLLVYLFTGIVASLTSLWWHDATVSVGASGAIFGLYGVFLGLLVTKALPKAFANKAFLTSILIFVGYNLLMGLSAGIDNAAHIGGLLSGFIIGFILSQQIKQQKEEQVLLEPVEANDIRETAGQETYSLPL